jgi:hypothetical protein
MYSNSVIVIDMWRKAVQLEVVPTRCPRNRCMRYVSVFNLDRVHDVRLVITVSIARAKAKTTAPSMQHEQDELLSKGPFEINSTKGAPYSWSKQ